MTEMQTIEFELAIRARLSGLYLISARAKYEGLPHWYRVEYLTATSGKTRSFTIAAEAFEFRAEDYELHFPIIWRDPVH